MDTVLVSGITVRVRGASVRRDGGVQATLDFRWDGAPLLTHSCNLSDAEVRVALAENLARKTSEDEQSLRRALSRLEGDLAQSLADGNGQAGETGPVLVTLANVPREEIAWLWPPYLPRRRLSLLDGDPGVGKSWLSLAIAAAVTRGTPLPGQESANEPANVLLLTAEDGLGDTIRPRLEDMGADLSRVKVLTAIRDGKGGERHPSLVVDLPALEQALAEGGYALVIIDPINAYLGTALDTHRDASLRAVLTPLASLADRWNVAILCIRHLTKGGRDRAIYRGQGSIAYTAAARVVHLVGVNPDNPQERVIACIKNNLAPQPPAIAFAVAEGRFLWRGETSVTAAAMLAPDGDEGERSAVEDAMGYLRESLSGGPMDQKQMQREARDAGITDRTLRRAKARLNVTSKREGGLGPAGRWVWSLP